ncbi:Enhanced ethylene response protein 5 [Citrus sinensis]|uniref:Enhanced ethylene response protein 5 n=1 Tax=Citrus sinensis TaxID=2711 RepID=A0ACB8NU14_CITSI|nr:Enhanced ethylene response protein 5 [Citrus sinensis]
MAYMSMGEAHRRITDYLNRFSDAVSSQDVASLKQLLSFSSNSPSLLSLADSLNVFQDANRLIKQSDNYSPFADITVPLFRSLQHYRTGNLVDAYLAFEKSANAFIQEFRNWESAWALEALYVIAYEIRVLAERADRELASNGKSPEKLKAAGSFLMKVFGVLALGTVHLCRSVIRSIETARIFDFEEFPKRDKVTYMYYTGRLEVFNENFPAADQKLSYALINCNPRSEANIRSVSAVLIVVLSQYSNIVQALRRGDLRLLRHALEEHEDHYIIQKQKDPSKAHQMKLDVIVKALKWLEMDMDVDEVECIVAILIHKNLVKGYFAHKSKVVVLSKQDPFPKLNGKPVNS